MSRSVHNSAMIRLRSTHSDRLTSVSSQTARHRTTPSRVPTAGVETTDEAWVLLPEAPNPATDGRALRWGRAAARERPHQHQSASSGSTKQHRSYASKERYLRAGKPLDRDQWPMWAPRRQGRADDSHPSRRARGVGDDRERRRAGLARPNRPWLARRLAASSSRRN